MMSGSQLTVEYEGMGGRHELYAKYGIAAEAAQLLETELGTLLLALRGLESDWYLVPDGVAAKAVLDTIDRSTLGRVLNDLKRHIAIEGDLEESFASALKSRNRLTHGFFERHNFKIQTEDGRRKMIAELDLLHAELFVAWQAAHKLTTIISAVVQHCAAGRP
jgi:hypothetical protein